MKSVTGLSVLLVAALAASPPASARVDLSIQISPYQYAPPVVYEPAPYYAPPPVVYFGSGEWGGGRGDHAPRDRRPREPDRRHDSRDNDKHDKPAKRRD